MTAPEEPVEWQKRRQALRSCLMGPANRRVVAVAYDGLCVFEYGVAAELFGLARPELGVDWCTASKPSAPIRRRCA